MSVIADSVNDFSGSQGKNNWRYGEYRSIFKPSNFQEFKHYHKSGGEYIWSAEKPAGYNNFNQLWASGGHPNSQQGKHSWAVRRWKSNYNGKVNLTGTIDDTNRRGGGDGITGRIFHNEKEVYNKRVNHNSQSNGFEYNINLDISKGDTIDFAIDYNGWDGDDSTKFTTLITARQIPLSDFSIADASFREGKGGDVTINRTGGTTTSQTLRVKSSDGSATTADDDYAAINKTVSFAAGETSKTISVSTTADLDVENDETFSLTITAEGTDDVPPQISDGTATVTIKADDLRGIAFIPC